MDNPIFRRKSAIIRTVGPFITPPPCRRAPEWLRCGWGDGTHDAVDSS
nr:MAG TPA: hypothetical protein [Caudoviricetes sp.]